MDVKQDIEKGFQAMAGGVKEAGHKRNLELVKKQGYVAFKNADAVALFHANPLYANWACKYVDGEYRFYPPLNNTQIKVDSEKKESTPVDLLEAYKQAAQTGMQVKFTGQVLQPSSGECLFKITLFDKSTGTQTIFLEEIGLLDSKFMYKTLPSIYNQVCNGLPTIEQIKINSISFLSIDGNFGLALGNLNSAQLQIVKDMQAFVEQQLHSTNEQKGR